MGIEVSCSNCGKAYTFSDDSGGHKARCGSCNSMFMVATSSEIKEAEPDTVDPKGIRSKAVQEAARIKRSHVSPSRQGRLAPNRRYVVRKSNGSLILALAIVLVGCGVIGAILLTPKKEAGRPSDFNAPDASNSSDRERVPAPRTSKQNITLSFHELERRVQEIDDKKLDQLVGAATVLNMLYNGYLSSAGDLLGRVEEGNPSDREWIRSEIQRLKPLIEKAKVDAEQNLKAFEWASEINGEYIRSSRYEQKAFRILWLYSTISAGPTIVKESSRIVDKCDQLIRR